MSSDRVNVRLPEPLAEHLSRVIGPKGFYETPSEYIRSLIRRDMERSDVYQIQQGILSGFRDISKGKYFKGTGNFKKDMKLFTQKESKSWK